MRQTIIAVFVAAFVPGLVHAGDRLSNEISIERSAFAYGGPSGGGWQASLALGGRTRQWFLQGNVLADDGWTLRGEKEALVLAGARWKGDLDSKGRVQGYGQLTAGAVVAPIFWPVLGAGLGLDVKLQERVALRFGADLVGTVVPGGVGAVPRVSAGVVFGIGEGDRIRARRSSPRP